MADPQTDADIISLVQSSYVPFLKRLIAHMEKKSRTQQPKSFEKLKYVYQVFTEADVKEKVDVYHACKDMLERWHQRYKDMKNHGDKKTSILDSGALSENSQSGDASQDKIIQSSSAGKDSTGKLAIVSVVSCSGSSSVSQKNVTERPGGVVIQDEIEIENPATAAGASYSALTEPGEKWKLVNIKKEKEEPVPTKPVQVPYTQPQVSPAGQAPASAPPTQAQSNSQAESAAAQGPKKPVEFVCASCQFHTLDETEFMKHARTDHRTDLSLWCKHCGKCFSNAGVLVAHIKENNCEKEEMIYRCGVKDCTFETPSGQTFVHHLRHCHKGSPFIFCVHCQKIFTLPHCLILHMQNECPFKEKNRKNPSAAGSQKSAQPVPPPPPQQPAVNSLLLAGAKPVQSFEKQPVQKPQAASLSNNKPVSAASPRAAAIAATAAPRRGGGARNRGRGNRGRSRTLYSDSSESDDPDDPSWKPEESLNSQPRRRSARWAKKVSESKNPDLYDGDSSSSSKKISEQPGKTLYNCPCCDFSASFKSLMNDHYITDHKNPMRNSCLVCSVKFESLQLFLDHFPLHEKDKDGNAAIPAVTENEEDTDSKDSRTDVPVETVPGSQSNVVVDSKQPQSVMKIPYQTAIHEKLQKEGRVKSFEELKAPADLQKMKVETKMKHFYKCVIYNCAFTTDDSVFYVSHLTEHHKGKRLYCVYCYTELATPQELADHMLQEHGRRCYQCSLCFYRGLSKPHVQIHIKNAHISEKAQVYACSTHLPPDYTFKDETENSDLTTTWPYVCAIGECKFQTYDPKEFKKHNEVTHRSVTVFLCYYCKVDFISFKRLMSHYHLHGINNFQCTYCVHGSDTKEEILLHLCNCHADKPFKVHVRAAHEDAPTSKKSIFDVSTVSDVIKKVPLPPLQQHVTKDAKDIGITKASEDLPVEVKNFNKDVFCRMPFCEKELPNLALYVNHVADVHNSSNISCPYCSRVEDGVAAFADHMICHGPTLFACVSDVCSWHSWDEAQVAEHMKAAHQLKDALPTVVRRSSTSLQTPEDLLSSGLGSAMARNTTGGGYVCIFCYFQTQDSGALKNHMYLDLNYKRFMCNICKMKCYSRKDASQHFNEFHSHHNIKCSIDSNPEIEYLVKSYLSPNIQKIVQEYVQNEEKALNPVATRFPCFMSTYVCDNCPRSFSRIREMQHHFLLCLYKAYQPYLCGHCDVKVSDFLSLKLHTNEFHPDEKVTYVAYKNKLLEEQIGRTLQCKRAAFFAKIMESLLPDRSHLQSIRNKTSVIEPKMYKCGYCRFNDSFRSNVEKHCQGCHKNKIVDVEKISKSSSLLPTAALSQSDNSSEASMDTSDSPPVLTDASVRRYMCGFCTKKTFTLTELEDHIDSHHAMREEETYPYFYWPDPDLDYPANDTVLYECAYCSVSQENLYHLKRHCNNLHSEVPFKVRGLKSKDCSMIECGYCSYKVMSYELLMRHCRFHHPKKPVRAAGETADLKHPVKRKASGDSGKTSSKAAKVEEKLLCHYCGSEFMSYMKLLNHHDKSHKGMPMKYDKCHREDGRVESNNLSLMYCTMCSFIGEEKLLYKHMSIKHKDSVGCAYCKKYFENMSKLEEHNEEMHEGKPLSTVSFNDALVKSESEESTTSPKASCSYSTDIDGPFSYYGVKPEPLDLENITVNLETKETSSTTKLPVVYLTRMFKMFPKVIVKDIYKSS